MGNSYIGLPKDSNGKKLRTRTVTEGSEVHDEVVRLSDTSDALVNPATEETLLLVKTAVENIDIDADTINLNTDQLETKIDTTNASLSSIDGKITSCNTGSISGTVTANAGINLNTSALALEAGGNLATLTGKDFATQTTLALIKSKTDNLDTALSGIKTGTDKIPASPSTLAGQQDALSHYKISNVDADASPNYYGYEDKDGNWYILKETVSAGADTYLYCKGTGGLSSVWTNRATESYASFSVTF